MLGLLRQPEQGTISYEARLLFIRCVGKTSPNSSKNGINVRQPRRRVQGKLEESPVPPAAVLASRPGAGTIKEPDHHRHSRNKNCIHGLGFEGRGHLMIRLEHLTAVHCGRGPHKMLNMPVKSLLPWDKGLWAGAQTQARMSLLLPPPLVEAPGCTRTSIASGRWVKTSSWSDGSLGLYQLVFVKRLKTKIQTWC